MEDSLAEDRHSPVPGLVHRYPDRVLMLVTTQCASYCRYCTRSRIVGDPSATFSRADFELQIEYLKHTPQVRDVLLSGGDPLVLAPKLLEELLTRLREIPHIEIIRIGTRVPVFMPMRITDELCDMLQKYHPLWMNIHVNHPNEITAELAEACDKLSRAGIPLGNQSVLLAGVNDCVHIQRKLVQDLVRIRVRPYYLYQCDLVEGAGHFRTPVAKGIEIIEGLRGHTSGFAVPTFVVDAPGGGGKIPVMPNYLVSMSDHKMVLRNYEGFITTYEEPIQLHHARSQDLHILPEQTIRTRPGLACPACWMGTKCSSSPRTSTSCTPAAAACTACGLTRTSGNRWGLGLARRPDRMKKIFFYDIWGRFFENRFAIFKKNSQPSLPVHPSGWYTARVTSFLLLIMIVGLLLSACSAADSADCANLPANGPKIKIDGAWSRAADIGMPAAMDTPAPGTTTMSSQMGGSVTSAAYFVINNCGAEADTLLSVASDEPEAPECTSPRPSTT